MKPYADTNLFTRIYLELGDSAEADQLATQARAGLAAPLPIGWLHRVELANALEMHVFFGRHPPHVRAHQRPGAPHRVSLVSPLPVARGNPSAPLLLH